MRVVDVNVNGLRVLNAELLVMSNSLQSLKFRMENTLTQTGEFWKDDDFRRFKEVIEPCQMQVGELSERYQKLASHIQETIKVLEKVQSYNVGH